VGDEKITGATMTNDKQNINPTRKIIAISSVMYENFNDMQIIRTALCDDGTLWEIWNEKVWEMLPSIPQSTEETK
jgi:hypothetical protein